MDVNHIKPDVHIQTKEETNIVSIASFSIQTPQEIKDFIFKSSVLDLEKFLNEKFKYS